MSKTSCGHHVDNPVKISHVASNGNGFYICSKCCAEKWVREAVKRMSKEYK